MRLAKPVMNQMLTMNAKPSRHQGDIGVAGFDGGCQVKTLDEQRKSRKGKGMCQTCGEVRTHKPGIWKSLMPDTVEGIVYKGICLKCTTLDAAKMQLCEPIDSAGGNDQHHSLSYIHDSYDAIQVSNVDYRPSILGVGHKSVPSQDSELNGRHTSSDTNVNYSNEIRPARKRLSKVTQKVISLQKFDDIYQRTASSISSNLIGDSNDNDGSPETSMKSLIDEIAPNCKESDVHSKPSFHSRAGHNSEHHQGNQNKAMNAKQNTAYNPFTCKGNNESTKKHISDYRCSDTSGDSGFYTGTAVSGNDDEEEYIPHGRGEMVYDEGKIAKGVWSNGLLKIQVPSDRERYEPFLLPDYSLGDMGGKEDMMNLPREEAVKAVSLLHINDCAFIRRSDGTWSYAIVKSRVDGQSPTITFQVKPRGSTKEFTRKQWGGHVRLPTKPDTLPQYSVGDPGREEDMIIEASKTDTVKAVSLLRLRDAAFVKRSDGSWAYALVMERSGGEIKFEVNARGSTKVIGVLQCGKFVRRVKHNSSSSGGDGLTEQEVGAIFKAMRSSECKRI